MAACRSAAVGVRVWFACVRSYPYIYTKVRGSQGHAVRGRVTSMPARYLAAVWCTQGLSRCPGRYPNVFSEWSDGACVSRAKVLRELPGRLDGARAIGVPAGLGHVQVRHVRLDTRTSTDSDRRSSGGIGAMPRSCVVRLSRDRCGGSR